MESAYRSIVCGLMITNHISFGFAHYVTIRIFFKILCKISLCLSYVVHKSEMSVNKYIWLP